MVVRYVADVRVIDVQKRRTPSKHYVYVIEVTWSDGSQSIVYRRYSKFFALQTHLIDTFPVEGGVKDPANRTLPFLPGKIIFGRSHVREVALKRKDPIHDYCQALIKLPKVVSECDLVLTFFQPTEEDLAGADIDGRKKSPKTADVISDPVLLEQYVALADYKATSKNRVNLISGDTVEVIEKHENGWWLVSIDDEQGWAPSSYLHPLHGGPDANKAENFKSGQEPRYVCVTNFVASLPDEISLDSGMMVDVRSKQSDGWWLIKYKGKEGWAPRANLKKAYVKDTAGERLQRLTPPKPKARKRTGVQPPPRRRTVKAKLDKQLRSMSEDGKEIATSTNDPAFYEGLVKSDSPEVEYVALSDYKLSSGGKKLSLNQGATINVIEKAPNGWWYVKIGKDQEGWVPADIIEKRRKNAFDDEEQPDYENVARLAPPEPSFLSPSLFGSLNDEFRDRTQSHDSLGASDATDFIAIGAYNSADETGISFKEGAIAAVLEKNESGWWFIKIGNEEGWAPSTFLQPHTGPQKIVSNPKRSPSSERIPVFLPPAKPGRKLEVDSEYENVEAGRANGHGKAPARPQLKRPPPQTAERAPKPSPRQPGDTIPVNAVDHNRNQLPLKSNEGNKVSKMKAALQRTQKVEDAGEKKAAPIPRPKPRTIHAPAAKSVSRPVRPPSPSKSKVLPKRPPPPNFATKERRHQQETSKAKTNLFVAIASYTDDDQGMLSFSKGQMIEVLDMDSGGWWFASVNKQSGWVPSNYLKQPTA